MPRPAAATSVVTAPPSGADDARDRILQAARAVVTERGPAGATFEVIAERAGVSRGLVHYHFKRKDALFVAVAADACESYRLVTADAIARARSVDDLIDLFVATIARMLGDDDPFFALYYELCGLARHSPEIAGEMSALGDNMYPTLAAGLEAAARAGLVAHVADPLATAQMVVCLIDGILLHALSGEDATRAIAGAAEALRRVLAPAAPAASLVSPASPAPTA